MELFANGIDGVTGEPLLGQVDASRIVQLAQGDRAQAGLLGWVRKLVRVWTEPHHGLPLGLDPADPAQAGWGVVFPADAPDALRQALAPLVTHRRERFGAERVKVLDYQPGESWSAWLARHGVEAGSVLPQRVPYYLLLAGDPRSIPFDVERLLAVEYAVGRLAFDTAEEYSRYAASVIDYETGTALPHARDAVFFAVRHPGDRATCLSADHLVAPLAAGLTGCNVRTLHEAAATKANLAAALAGPRSPALLFCAAHGVGWPCGHPQQRERQGALLCQDWPGSGGVGTEHFFAGEDLSADARVHGTMAFFFACYGAGTPERDEYVHEPGKLPRRIADQPFVARLPQRLLAHPQGGALAVLGHVERAWTWSIGGPSNKPQRLPFANTVAGLLAGLPAGHALRDVRQRYAALSAGLAEMLEQKGFGKEIADDEIAEAWIARNDARNYAVLGDPAVRLRFDAMEARG